MAPFVANPEEITVSRLSMKDVMVPGGSSGFEWVSEVYRTPSVLSNYVYL
jgi:hypothetical protein